MGFLDKAKQALASNKGKVGGLVGQHGDKIDKGLGKAADLVDKRTGGKHTDKIAKGREKVRGALDNLDGPTGGPTPPPPGRPVPPPPPPGRPIPPPPPPGRPVPPPPPPGGQPPPPPPPSPLP